MLKLPAWPLAALLLIPTLHAADSEPREARDAQAECLRESVLTAAPNQSINELRKACLKKLAVKQGKNGNDNPVARRRRLEQASQFNPFVITPHRPNYLMPISYKHRHNVEPLRAAGSDIEFDRWEIKFQFSFKIPVKTGIFGHTGDLYFAYTNMSLWQAYNEANSSPFRDTNHEPELFLHFDTDWSLFGIQTNAVQLGFAHQSNGRSGFLSRSWNYVYANLLFGTEDFYVSFKPFWRIPEEDKETPDDPRGDDNPDLTDFTGHFQLVVARSYDEQNLSLLLRNNLESDNKGSVQLAWSFPIGNRVRGYVQYFNGYAENLLDYDSYSQRLGIGVQITDWL